MDVIDIKTIDKLSELIGGDKEALHELIETFIEEGAEIIVAMKESVADENLDVLRRGAHSMKASAQDFGAATLSELNATLESQCKASWPVNAASQTEEIAQHFSAATDELKRYINNNQ